jgi:flagellar export protein FliJ
VITLSSYPLEKLLNLQQQKERLRQLELAYAERERQKQEESIAAMEVKLVEELTSHLHPELLEHRARFTVATQRKISYKREQLRAQAEACHQARALLLKARVDTKKFEVHKDSHLAEVKLNEQRLGQAAADEAARQQFLRLQEVCGNEN